MGGAVPWVIGAMIAFDLLIVPLIIRAIVAGTWGPLAERHPGVDPGPDAVRREFQSYKVGLLNLGLSVHTAVDESHLHLRPALFGRLIGMKPTSIPWEEIEPVRLRGKHHAEVKIGAERVLGPAWALAMAFPAEEAGEGPSA